MNYIIIHFYSNVYYHESRTYQYLSDNDPVQQQMQRAIKAKI